MFFLVWLCKVVYDGQLKFEEQVVLLRSQHVILHLPYILITYSVIGLIEDYFHILSCLNAREDFCLWHCIIKTFLI